MDLRKDCQLIEVVYENDAKKAKMTFLDEANGEVLDVVFNKQSYDQEKAKFSDDPEKAKKVDEWCKEYFDCTFEELGQQVGKIMDIYRYERFNSFWESQETKKFTPEDKGKFFQTEIKRVVDDGFAIHIYFDHKGSEYETKFTYSDYIENLKKWFVNPQKKIKQTERFAKTFGVSVEDAEAIYGKPINVEVKLAFGKFPYAEIKQPDWN